ncbi:MAG: DUF4013 domain-containing protein [Methanobrevibacter sp.]|jgi:hypothetical protein|nr:DUF4013 domain-containing protein [Methanobrevibacter sp.]
MSIESIFEDSFSYTKKNLETVLLLGVLYLIGGITSSVASLGGNLKPFNWLFIFGIISIIFFFFIDGYGISVLRKTISGDNELPKLNLKENLIDGIKKLAIKIVYFIIPTVVTVVMIFLTMRNYINASTSAPPLPEYIIPVLILACIISLALYIIFLLLYLIALPRFTYKNSLKEGLKINKVFEDISKIGWVHYITFLVVLALILCVAGIISFLVMLIPIFGILVFILLILPFTTIFIYRSFALLYKNSIISENEIKEEVIDE